MALEVVLGPPFAGKSQFVRSRIEERERAGELGLIGLDFSALFGALFPGALSSYRDAAVSETGAPRFASYVFEAALAQAIARGLSGYVALNSPLRALRVADRVDARYIIEVDVDVDVVVDRIDDHLTTIRQRVPRARTSAATAKCSQAAAAFYREAPAAYERMDRRTARRSGNGWKVSETARRGFDQAAFDRGLTAAGRVARDALVAEGLEATPAAIFRRLLQERTA